MENDSGVSRENSENHESQEKPEAGAGKRRRQFTRHGYLRDFIRNDRGEYLYDGDVYCYNTPEIPFQSAFLRLLLLSCGAFLAQIPGGCFQSAGMRDSFYVVLPYVCALVSAGSMIWALVRLKWAGDPVRDYLYRVSAKAFPLRAWLAVGFSFLAFLGQWIYLALHGAEGLLPETLAFQLLECVSAAAAFLAWRYFQKLSWKKRPGGQYRSGNG